MTNGTQIGKVWNIPITLHISWFLVFGLVTFSLATAYFPQAYPTLSLVDYVILGALTSLFFAVSVLAHELGHALVALRNGVPVKNITLFIFGGVAQIAHEPRTPGAEFRIAIAGPLVSLALAIFFEGVWYLDRNIPILAAPSEYLMRINLILALFNMIPGFPLDGGRVLRALVWWRTKNVLTATNIAAISGRVIAFGFIGFGVFTVLNGNIMDGLWLAFIGWFLHNEAASAQFQTKFEIALSGMRVNQVMSKDFIIISHLTPLSQIVNEHVILGGHKVFYVAEGDRLNGILTLQEINQTPQSKWGFTTAGQVMIPMDRMARVEPDTELVTALKELEGLAIPQVPVIHGERIVGTLDRENVFRYLRLRESLGI
jgi:Zn-dependent protease